MNAQVGPQHSLPARAPSAHAHAHSHRSAIAERSSKSQLSVQPSCSQIFLYYSLTRVFWLFDFSPSNRGVTGPGGGGAWC